MSVEIVFTLFHEGGASDEIHTAEWPELPIPRIGEYVTIGPVVHGFVYDVNHDYYIEGKQRRVYIHMPCDGDPLLDCEWECDSDHKRTHANEIRGYTDPVSDPCEWTGNGDDRLVLKVPSGTQVGMSTELYDLLQSSGRLELFGEARIPGRGVVSDHE